MENAVAPNTLRATAKFDGPIDDEATLASLINVGGRGRCAITLDPHAIQEAQVELPLWRFGLPDDAVLDVEDQVSGTHFRWTGRYQQIRLDPHAMPFAIWRIRPPGWTGRAEGSTP